MSALTILVLEPEVLSSSLSQEKKQTASRLRRKKGNCLLTHRQYDFYKMLGSREQPKKRTSTNKQVQKAYRHNINAKKSVLFLHAYY